MMIIRQGLEFMIVYLVSYLCTGLRGSSTTTFVNISDGDSEILYLLVRSFDLTRTV
jgi:hypothetical protein